MKDLILLITIISFWFLYTITASSIGADSTLSSLEGGTNFSNEIDINTGEILANFSIDDDIAPTVSKTKNFWNMVGQMFGLRIGTSGFPPIIQNTLTTVNYILLLLIGLIIFRAFRHGGG